MKNAFDTSPSNSLKGNLKFEVVTLLYSTTIIILGSELVRKDRLIRNWDWAITGALGFQGGSNNIISYQVNSHCYSTRALKIGRFPLLLLAVID